MGVRKQWLLAIQETKKSTVGGAYEYAEIFRYYGRTCQQNPALYVMIPVQWKILSFTANL